MLLALAYQCLLSSMLAIVDSEPICVIHAPWPLNYAPRHLSTSQQTYPSRSLPGPTIAGRKTSRLFQVSFGTKFCVVIGFESTYLCYIHAKITTFGILGTMRSSIWRSNRPLITASPSSANTLWRSFHYRSLDLSTRSANLSMQRREHGERRNAGKPD